MMDKETFLKLPALEIARLVQKSGSGVCCFPINGTRRWHLLEGGSEEDYLERVTRRHIEIYQMLVDHGLSTIIAPFFGSELLGRGGEYMRLAAEGLAGLAKNKLFLDFYQTFGVRVHFYGDYRRQFASTPYAYLSDLFDAVTLKTEENTRVRMFYGVFAGNVAEAVAKYSVQYHSANGKIPTEAEIIDMYYGEPIGPVNLFIGFDKFSIFDMPLLSTENTDLYFTASPSLYMDERQLRAILYDHLFSRRVPEPDYDSLTDGSMAEMRGFYRAHADQIYGVGTVRGGIWYPA